MALFVCLGLIAAIKVLKNGTQKCDKNERKSVTHIAKKFGWGYNEKTLKTETVYAFRMRFYCL